MLHEVFARREELREVLGTADCHCAFVWDHRLAGIPGEEGTVKTFTRKGNKVVLVPSNARLAPMEFDAAEVTIYGKVVTVVRRL